MGTEHGAAEARVHAVEFPHQAIELGFSHYGLSEHAPRFEASALFPEEKRARSTDRCAPRDS